MKIEKCIGFWSGDYNQTTGQALVTAHVIKSRPACGWREYVYRGAGRRSLLSWVKAALRLWHDIVFGRTKSLYLVCSRSNGGFLRDIPALSAAHFGVRTIVHVHGSDIVDLLSARRLSPLARKLYSRCEFVVPSIHLLEPLRALTPAQIHLCENYSFSEFSTDLVRRKALASEMFTVFWNSNVMASKGFFDLADAMTELHRRGLRVRLVSVGQPLGDEEMSAEEVVIKLNALLTQGWFDYRGKMEPQEAAVLLDEMQVVCLPSHSECQPLAIIEAMCAGKTIVVSDIPALRATLGDYPAHFVSVRSPRAIANSLFKLLVQWQTGPAAFDESAKAGEVAKARARFSVARFDRNMAQILVGDAEQGAGE